MGDKSLKSKERDLKHKTAARVQTAAAAKSKQEGHIRSNPNPAKGTK